MFLKEVMEESMFRAIELSGLTFPPKLIDSSSKREKVFMTTKVSNFQGVRNKMYRDIYEGLPEGNKAAIRKI